MIPELIVFFTAMIPFIELKLSIPLGLELGLSSTTTFLFSMAGAIIPPTIILAIIGPLSTWGRKRSKFLNKFFKNLFRKTRKDHSKKFNRYGSLFIIALIAIPIPGSGSATGAIVAFIFGVDYWKSVSMVCAGVACSAILLTAGFESVFAILDLFT
jgi:uncharacterized membrane protein